jgi:hypothetical protein
MHSSINNRLSSLGLESWDLGGAGDCFFHCIAHLVGMTVPDLRSQAYCDLVATCGIYVEGNAEIAAAADFISRHLLIFGADANHDVYIFAGDIGLGLLRTSVSMKVLSSLHTAPSHIIVHVLGNFIILGVLHKEQSVPESKSFVDRMRVRQNSLSVRVQLLSLVLDL